MRKNYKRLLAAAGGLAAAAAIAAAPIAAASAAPVASGTEHFQIMTTSATANKADVITFGLFTAAGVDIQGQKVDTFRLPGGSFKVAHSNGTGSQRFNPATCLLQLSLHGTYTVGHGTGRYARISGHGTYQLSIVGLGAKVHGRCSQSAPPIAFQQVIDASGPVRL
ncbi:MAG TPA: hypothetical protein VGR98_00680 [Streptosporangiaceae bacterium]|jgi:hypothetical protein|nr:hypothetical protein [Streptosporangiaceae bacterium]